MEVGKYGRMKLKEDEVLVKQGVLKFPSSPEERPSLIGGKCKSCGDVSFPRRHFCPKCGSQTQKFLLGSFAEVVTYSIVHQGGMGIKTPYIVAMVNFPEINDPELALVCRIVDCSMEDIKIGMPVELIIDRVRSTFLGAIVERFGMPGQSVIGYCYRPVKEVK